MKKIILLLTLFTSLGFTATPAQVEQYLSVSNAEEELISLEREFSAMQNSFSQDTNSSTYDMQMLTLRFKEYLQKHLSDNEMDEILANYKNIILLQFVSASSQVQNNDLNESDAYIKKLMADPQSNVRIGLIEKIRDKFYSKEALVLMFDDLMKPLIQKGIGGDKINQELLKNSKENYIKMMTNAAKKELLYTSKDFTIEELEALLKIAKTPATEHESKAVFGGMAYALKEFFMSLASRYDVSKHQPQQTKH